MRLLCCSLLGKTSSSEDVRFGTNSAAARPGEPRVVLSVFPQFVLPGLNRAADLTKDHAHKDRNRGLTPPWRSV
jgi:hypothetical protein